MAASPTLAADRLLEHGVIDPARHQQAMAHFQQYGGFIEEALIDSRAMDEADLLKSLAQIYRTRFVATSKLKKADIGPRVLHAIKPEFAIEHNVFPILLDEESQTLSIVTADPTNLDVEQAVARQAGVARVVSYLARPAAIKAAIAKFYRGDIHAFASVDRETVEQFQSMMNIYERNLLDEGAMAAAVASSAASTREQVLSEDDIARRGERPSAAPDSAGGLSIELARVLVSLIESTRAELSGHSVITSTFVERMCRRIGLSDFATGAVTLAALLHDMGKGAPFHLTAFNVAEWDGHRTTAENRFEVPIRLFESARLPTEAVAAIRHMYERHDGRGFPERRKGGEIPLGARILALADTFADLTSNPRNPFRRILATEEAMAVLQKGRDTVFDGALVDLFATVVAGDDLKRQLLTGALTVLLVEPSPEACAILEMQLMTRGFKLRTAHKADDAIKILLKEQINIILTEAELKPFDGFELKRRLNEDPRTRAIPLIYFTARSGGEDVSKGFGLGAEDFLAKPSSIDVVAAKLHKYLERAGTAATRAGVAGSLSDMSLPDLVQILAHSRKTGRLSVTSGAKRGEIHFVGGDIYDAAIDNLRGDSAVFAMLSFREGSFSLDPSFTATSRAIQATAEMLLLEGMRRMDEERR
jgi:response regulator RpfG family c-di-GMP phosphodiesterase